MTSTLERLERVPATGAPLPRERGQVTEYLFERLRRRPGVLGERWPEEIEEEDRELALYCCYELHYRGFAGVPSEWEWEPSLLSLRLRLERDLDARLREERGAWRGGGQHVQALLGDLATGGPEPSLSGWMAEQGTLEQAVELAKHRSAYQLKEADPHTWAIPRLAGRAKAALVAIQADEYGGGVPAAMHSTLFAQTMVDLGLDPTPNRYLDQLPASTLATTNLISFLGLHRRWRGALVGHLALFEMTSSQPMTRHGAALRRLGLPIEARRFFDVHAEADLLHQVVAVEEMVGGLLADEPELAGEVVAGARMLADVEARFSRHLLSSWAAGRSSLRS